MKKPEIDWSKWDAVAAPIKAIPPGAVNAEMFAKHLGYKSDRASVLLREAVADGRAERIWDGRKFWYVLK